MTCVSAMAGASLPSDPASGKVFSGENEDPLEYKRWKTWVSNKLMTLDSKVPKEARGAYVYTPLAVSKLKMIDLSKGLRYWNATRLPELREI